MKINEYGDVIFSENDAIELIYNDPDFNIGQLFFENVEKYNARYEKYKKFGKFIEFEY